MFVNHRFFKNISAQPDEPQAISAPPAGSGPVLGDSVTTDHISPRRRYSQPIRPPASWLSEQGVERSGTTTRTARGRGNHEVMLRGTFANIRLRNRLAGGVDGGWTRIQPEGELMSIYDAAMRYRDEGTRRWWFWPARNTAAGSSRDWAAKGTALAGCARGDRRRASSASTAPIWWVWACIRWSFLTAQNAADRWAWMAARASTFRRAQRSGTWRVRASRADGSPRCNSPLAPGSTPPKEREYFQPWGHPALRAAPAGGELTRGGRAPAIDGHRGARAAHTCRSRAGQGLRAGAARFEESPSTCRATAALGC